MMEYTLIEGCIAAIWVGAGLFWVIITIKHTLIFPPDEEKIRQIIREELSDLLKQDQARVDGEKDA